MSNQNKILNMLRYLFIILSLSILIYHVSQLIKQYIAHPTSINIIPEATPFINPDHVFCPLNPISRIIHKHASVEDRERFSKIWQTLIDYKTATSDISFVKMLFWETVPDPLKYSLLGQHLRVKVSPPSHKIDIIPHWKHFFCFRVQSVNEMVPESYLFSNMEISRNVNETLGTDYLDEDMMTDMGLVSAWTGFKVYLVNRGEYPHGRSVSFTFHDGYYVYSKLSMTAYRLLNKPSRPCTNYRRTIHYLNHMHINSTLEFNYTYADCYFNMYNNLRVSKCNCTTHRYPFSMELEKQGIEFCFNLTTILEEIQMREPENDATYYFMKAKEIMEERKRCLSRCDDYNKVFEAQCSASQTLCSTNIYRYQLEKNVWPHKSKDSFISYKTDEIDGRSMVMEEKFSYLLQNLASDIGGIFGFYLGMSVLTMYEGIRFFLNLIQKKTSCSSDGQQNQKLAKEMSLV